MRLRLWLLFLLASVVTASAVIWIAPHRFSGGGTSYTLLQDGYVSGSGTGTWPIGDSADFRYAGIPFWSDGSDRTIGKITVKLSLGAGSITGKTLVAKIWSVGSPDTTFLNTVLATSDNVTGDDSWNLTDVDFVFSTPYTTTGGTDYHITLDMGGTDGSNYANAFHQNTNSVTGHLGSWHAALDKQNDLSGFDLQAKIYITP